jgi:hypothetical protein
MGGDGRRDGSGRQPPLEGQASGGLVARGRRAPVRERREAAAVRGVSREGAGRKGERKITVRGL